ncbi:MAG: alpha-glucan family phosphorylase [Planctomycetes bacterium]|nr:alpha-glucan family phosphorylase [Planctomycetota bacterium]
MARIRQVERSAQSRTSTPQDVSLRLLALANNLWWSWNSRTRRLFAGLDPLLWESTRRNPIATIHRLPHERMTTLAGDQALLRELAGCEQELSQYLKARPWYQRAAGVRAPGALVAYFCSEYALDDSLPQFAGGLGVLAGDHLKSASDLGVPLVAVGLLYRAGYYQQQLLADGATRAVYPRYDFAELPVTDTGLSVRVPIAKKSVKARIWRASVGRVPLFLLDTDVPGNSPADRRITEALYIGSDDVRIQQQIVLGVGGVRALDALGLRPSVFHLNEGHAAFCQLERLRLATAKGKRWKAAIDAVANHTVFTTHTPVPAGNQRFDNRLVLRTLAQVRDSLDLPDQTLLDLGREKPGDRRESFCMTVLALRTSRHNNGVAALHGDVSRDMWRTVYQTTRAKDVPIGHVTNGIHAQTWLAPEMEPLYAKHLRPRWVGAGPADNWWKNADRIPSAEFWAVRSRLRRKLVHYIRTRLREQILRRFGPASDLSAAHDLFSEDALTIGFARRFATYKRAPLIFRDAKRLARIVNDAKRPVQLVFAGKAHPADMGGQAFAQAVYQQAASAGLRGRVVVLENYDMQMGQMLTSGVDVWLNNPVRPQEASGTSGMKPPLEGGINCSILDGWWPEGYDGRNGWAIGDGRALSTPKAQDRYDADCIYTLLEKKIVPLFYNRNSAGVPVGWVKTALHSMKTVCGQFNTHRMVAEYWENYYRPAHRGEVK